MTSKKTNDLSDAINSVTSSFRINEPYSSFIHDHGTHEQLLEQKGTYYQLYTGAFELE